MHICELIYRCKGDINKCDHRKVAKGKLCKHLEFTDQDGWECHNYQVTSQVTGLTEVIKENANLKAFIDTLGYSSEDLANWIKLKEINYPQKA